MNDCQRIAHLDVFLIRPTKYDDDGYLLRFWRNVLPSNSLACLHALTEAAADSPALRGVTVRARVFDEAVDSLPLRLVQAAARVPATRVVVCLVGVQTSQFPRACDLARRFRRLGLPVLIGGFHVSGMLAFDAAMPSELQDLMDAGVSVVQGEVEDSWADILADAIAAKLRPFYDCSRDKPDIARAPVPRLDARLERKFVFRHFATIDASRGCPFSCSFCTIINVQGRRMRARDPSALATAIEDNFINLGTHHYFFTDDDFARNPGWRAIFEMLIQLRKEKGIAIRFLMQVDALAHRQPDFVELARQAGCFQVFLGMESLNPSSLHEAGKRQNHVADYADLIATWHAAGVLTHVGYIIGFGQDTPGQVQEDLRRLREEVRPDIASFFLWTPLPGSVDHKRMLEHGERLDDDLNRYDTFHPVIDHPHMSRSQWSALYRQAWQDFYAPAILRRQLAQVSGEEHLTLMQMYLWYLAAIRVEGDHPMMSGFGRLKPRADRRDGVEVQNVLAHAYTRLREMRRSLVGYGTIVRELHDLWEQTSVDGQQAAQASRLGSWRAFVRLMLGGAPQSRAAIHTMPTIALSKHM